MSLILGVLSACGGEGTAGSSLLAPGVVPTDSHRAAFALAQPGPDQTAGLAIEVAEESAGTIIRVTAFEAVNTDAVLFTLNYDDGGYTPQAVQTTDAFADPARSLCLEILDTPGAVSFGQVPVDANARVVQPGAVLAEVLFTAEPFSSAHTAVAVPVNSGALCPLTYESDTGGLTLYYVNPGDYDQNGTVTASDLVPLGRHYGTAGPFEFTSMLAVVDGNDNGQIEVADLTVIGQHWGNNVESVNFYGSDSVDDVPVGYAEPSSITPLGNVAFADAIGDPLTDRLRFSFSYDSMVPIDIYWARPDADGAEGICSNLAGPEMLTQLGSVSNALPVAQLSLDYTDLDAPATVELDASGSSDLDGVIAFYEWDFEGDGLYEGFGAEPVVMHTYNAGGTYAPLVRVTDNLGAWAIAQADPLTVTEDLQPNTPPVADLVTTTTSGTVPLSVGLIASGSSDSDGYIAKYEWDFNGDGTYDLDSGTDPTVINAYETAGDYPATVRVTDDRGDTATDSVVINVVAEPLPNEPPVAQLTADPSYGEVPLTVTLDASGSYDTDSTIVKYEWDFDGDGNYEEYGSSCYASHIYTEFGTFNARIRVTDNSGNSSTSTTGISACQPPTSYDVWPMFGHDPSHTGRSAYTGPQSNEMELFYLFNYDVRSTPVITEEGMLYAGTLNDGLVAFNLDGGYKWSYPTAEQIGSTPTVGPDGAIFFGCYDHNLYALNNDGSYRWSYTTGDLIISSPAIGTDGTVYVGSHDHSLYAINSDGSLGWSYATGGYVYSSPVVAGGVVYVGSSDGSLYAIDTTGSLLWAFPTGAAVWSSPAVGTDGTVYIGSYDGNLYAINPDGSLQWTYTTGGPVNGSPAIGADGTVYVGSDDYNLYAINPDGSLRWTFATTDKVQATPIIGEDGTVYLSSVIGFLYAVSSTGNQLWFYNQISQYSDPVAGPDDRIYTFQINLGWEAFNQTGQKSSVIPKARGNNCPSINADGKLFVGTDSSDAAGGTCAIATDGCLQWLNGSGNSSWGVPAIGTDGTSYLGSITSDSFNAFTPAGELKWSVAVDDDWIYPPVLSPDGTVYFGCGETFYAIDAAGNLNWTFAASGDIRTTPAIGPDGTVYFASFNLTVEDDNFFALNRDGTVKWSYRTRGTNMYSSPAVAADGTVYIADYIEDFYAFNPDGSLQWTYAIGSQTGATPGLGADGTVYIGSGEGILYAFNPDGSLKWSFDTESNRLSSPAIGADGTIYCCGYDRKVFAVGHDGVLKWMSSAGGSPYSSPVIGQNGNLYIFDEDGNLYAFGS